MILEMKESASSNFMTTLKRPQFTASRLEMGYIDRIAKRAMQIAKEHGRQIRSKQDWIMDLEATHCSGCPLNLEKISHADDFNFAHGVFGIARHLNRDTGELENLFWPRYAL
jgi:hypothetical protein